MSSVGSLASNRAAFLTRTPRLGSTLQCSAFCVKAASRNRNNEEERSSSAPRMRKGRPVGPPDDNTEYGPRYGSELYSGGTTSGYPKQQSGNFRDRQGSFGTSTGYPTRHTKYSRNPEDVARKLGNASEILSVLSKPSVPYQADGNVSRPRAEDSERVMAVVNRIDEENGLAIGRVDERSRSKFVQGNPKTKRWPTEDGLRVPGWKGRKHEKQAKVAADRHQREAAMDEASYLKEDWRRNRIGWMVKEIPRLDCRHTVNILNSQVKWVGNRDISIIIKRLLHEKEFIRAHRVLKWSFLRPWFEVDFEVFSELADILAETGKLGRARDLFNIMTKKAYLPRRSTFIALVSGYLEFGRMADVEEAWKVYNKMITFGHYEPPASVSFRIFMFMVEYARSDSRWLDNADSVFNRIREAEISCTTEMYESLIVCHAARKNEQRVNDLVEDMRRAGVEISPPIFGAVIRVSARSGNYLKAEELFSELRTKEEPDWRYYVALIEAYGNAGLYDKALGLFQEIEASRECPLSLPYNAVIPVMADGNRIETAEMLLGKLQAGIVRPAIMQNSFNSVMRMYLRNGMEGKVEGVLEDMKSRGCLPNQESYNLVLEAYSSRRRIDMADELYQKMVKGECLRPNVRTYEIMIGAYGKARQKSKVKEVFERLTICKHPVPEEFKSYVDAAVNKAWVIRAEAFCKPRLQLDERWMIVGALLGGARMKHVSRRAFEIQFEQDANSYRGQLLIKDLYDKFIGWAVDRPRVEPIEPSRYLPHGHVEPIEPSPQGLVEAKGLDETGVLHFRLMGHPKFNFYSAQYRRNGVPRIPRLIHRWLNPVSLAYWYMYNGRRATSPSGIILEGAMYTFEEVCLVGEALRGKNMHCSVMKHREYGDTFYILVTAESADWLWRLMEPHIIKELVPLLKPGHEAAEAQICDVNRDEIVPVEAAAAAAAEASRASRYSSSAPSSLPSSCSPSGSASDEDEVDAEDQGEETSGVGYSRSEAESGDDMYLGDDGFH